MTTITVQDLSDLKAYAEKLVRTNLFLSHEERARWMKVVPQMHEEDLKDLIKAFEENQEQLKEAIMKNFEKDPEGKLVEKIKQYKKDSMKKMATDVKTNEAEKAEQDLDAELKNL